MRRLLTIGGALALLAAPAGVAAQTQARARALIEAARSDIGAPGIAAAVWRDGRILVDLAAGERALGSGVPVRPTDPFHIGSITKPFTALLAARLVERGILSWDDKVADWLGAAIEVGEPYRGVTLAELLSHRGGLSPGPHPQEAARLVRVRGEIERHLAVAELMMSLPPSAAPGRSYLYSNFSYVVAAAMIEQATGRPYEDLLREEVLQLLGLASAGFGAPGSAASIDAPRGHFAPGSALSGPVPPNSPLADNSDFLRPAGGLHMSMADLARFGADQLLGERGGGALLTRETYRLLHTPASSGYALGWGVGPGGALHHDGTNRRWFALLRLLPSERTVIAVAVNYAGDEERTRRALWRLSDRLRREAANPAR